MKNVRSFLLFVILLPISSAAQEYNGLTGLLHVPSAEPDSSGTFRGELRFCIVSSCPINIMGPIILWVIMLASLHGHGLFQNIYIAACKHIDIQGYELGAHLSYRYYTSNQNKNRRGVAGGLTLRPAFYKPLRLIVEWDGAGVNAGVDVLLWRHLFLQAGLIHGTGFMGGVAYHYRIPY